MTDQLEIPEDGAWDDLTPAEVDAILRAKATIGTYEFAYRRRYGLAPNAKDLAGVTLQTMIDDYWCHRLADDQRLAALDFHDVFKGRPEVPK